MCAANQPGGSFYGLNNSNLFNPFFDAITTDNTPGLARGNGVALHNGSSEVIGELGVSGDTAYADHAIAYAMRGLPNTTRPML